ncbi:helix-turn-helix protein [Asanoa ferruginea]|uniref:Helix-turn-helix protein n=2 Tax=Asanoa ferruginea TaxID=53367 RepID=A0A3D9ZXR5_9ACTN|nr:helix-turn-helix protein [Asanoa ferruginea]GIF48012.1 regulatory protein AfsR [Asanoa ferruginea]
MVFDMVMPPHPLRVHRRRLGLSQEELAAATGLSVRSIQSLESGRNRAPRSSTVRLLADALGLAGADRERFTRAMTGDDDEPARDDAPPRPAQLPAELPDFTGREEVADRLAAALRPGARPVVVSISGMAGVGKTSLALHVAHRVRGHYPDGQLYIDLRRAGRAEPYRAAGFFLRALGTPAGAVPTDAEERAALLRSVLAERSVLVLVDDVEHARDVLPLLPGAGPVGLLLTSRKPLPSLPVTLAVDLDLFSAEESVRLLAGVAGTDRAVADPTAAAEVVDACGRLPLAVRLAAVRLAARPAWSMRDLADRLAASDRRLHELGGTEQAVRASFDLSYQALPPHLAEAFRQLAWPRLGEISVDTVAAACDVDAAIAAGIAEDLVDARLLLSPRPGRYRYHDLVRLFAQERSRAADPPEVAARLVRRLVDGYRKTAVAALQTIEELPSPPFRDAAAATGWLTAEGQLIVAAVCLAAELTADVDAEACADLARALGPHLRATGEWDEWQRLADAVRQVAVRDGNRPAALLAGMQLGHLAILRNDYALAGSHLAAATDLARALGDRAAEARTLNLIGLLRFTEASPRPAIVAHRAALALFETLGHTAGVVNSRINLAKCLATQGRGAEGLAVLDEARRLLPPGPEVASVMLRHQTARCLFALRRYADAIEEHEACLELTRRHGLREGSAYVLAELGLTLLAAGQPDTARARLALAVSEFERLGDGNAADTYRVVLGLAQRALGDLEGARRNWRQAIRF